jgi:signal transduction histidine kinase
MAHPSPTPCRTLPERQQFLRQLQQKRLARKIHDLISQKLTLLSLQLSLAGAEARPPEAWAQSCQNWSMLTIEVGHALRDVINDLNPRALDETGFVPAIQWYANSLAENFPCRVMAPEEPIFLAPLAANELLSVCRDIIGGLFLPGGAAEASIKLELSEATLRVHLRAGKKNEGVVPVNAESLEKWGIPERMMCLEGFAEVTPEADTSLLITLSLPVTRQAAVLAMRAA